MSRFNWAPSAYRLLDGLFCIYKPVGVPVHKVIHSLKVNLCRDLNALPCYEHEIVLGQQPVMENLSTKSLSLRTDTSAVTDWSEHRLVLGDRYEDSDFNIHFVDGLSKNSTGVLVMSVGRFGRQSLEMVAMSKFLRVYHVKGQLGYATDDFTPTGHFLERTSFKHVSHSKLSRLCAAAQAAHTRQMYSLHGVNPDSQAAYEMAAKGIIRPRERRTMPVLYSVKCIDFQPPNFTLEIHSINETCTYLRQLVHDLALKLKSTAVCTGIRRLRYGHFDIDRALLRQHWHLDQIVDNIHGNMDLLDADKLFVGSGSEAFEGKNQRCLTDSDKGFDSEGGKLSPLSAGDVTGLSAGDDKRYSVDNHCERDNNDSHGHAFMDLSKTNESNDLTNSVYGKNLSSSEKNDPVQSGRAKNTETSAAEFSCEKQIDKPKS
ncbi:tRNA pseudouridine synthase b [Plakobranchus ocellatus]|uniref:tRNA pseudouridine synthase b n=1 Tax=Plakobranchus ocellatus TaxID=259542 RepID=A0AAV4BLZ7_9GAST|nr:tRNA pseudouridine synthase b [Plakobranchus ocellatus]